MLAAKQFKNVMSRMATGVTVISTKNTEGQFFAFTANSFTSVSLHPPMISFCLSKDAASFTAFKNTNKFAISILAYDQEELSRHFATAVIDKFADMNFSLGSYTKCPLLEGAVCWLECDKALEYEGGDHAIFLGNVEHAVINNDKKPLLYFARSYREIK